jgi:hypothetical protein
VNVVEFAVPEPVLLIDLVFPPTFILLVIDPAPNIVAVAKSA